ncbi:MAG: ribonuclease HI [Cyanobacteria bacterium]|nr:ribonuclease HI [Cyanobacteriota bacterium]MDW8202293.1 ribonuclease HI [Cyanobacteriota bacterium SKYGB_h_bin112]
MGNIKSIYTDGACSGNPGSGGWGVVIYFSDGTVHELGGAEPHTTNNRMELQAAIAALEFWQQVNPSEPVTLYTDSDYLRNGITKWISSWKKKGWKTSKGEAVLNQDLWQRLDALNSALVRWNYVKAHAGYEGNERCDQIARSFSLHKPIELRVSDHLVTDVKKSQHSLTQIADMSQVTVVKSSVNDHALITPGLAMTDSPVSTPPDSLDDLPREVRVGQLRNLVDTLRIADEVARKGYLITSSELADLMDVNASAVTSRGDHWVWRNWVVSRVRREGNQILWQLERVDG